jgi:hypothetical protein
MLYPNCTRNHAITYTNHRLTRYTPDKIENKRSRNRVVRSSFSAIQRLNFAYPVDKVYLIRRIKSTFESKTMSISDERGWNSNRNAKILLRSYLFKSNEHA